MPGYGRRVAVALAALAALAATLVTAPQARAAGMTTHAWMAEEAIHHVSEPRLRALLDAQRVMLMSGAQYPDSGYAVPSGNQFGADFGEVSHWEEFVNEYAAHIRSKPRCEGTLRDPLGPCAHLVAHLMGAAAHGMGDETWDWMFEPTMADHGETPASTERSRVDDTPGFAELGTLPFGPDFQHQLIAAEHAGMDNPFGALIGTSEYAMDVVAINRHRRLVFSPAPPPVEDLLAVYRRLDPETPEYGESAYTRQGLLAGHAVISGALAAERLSVAEAHSVESDLPYSSAHMHDANGGVHHTAVAVAGYYESLWQKLTTNSHPRPRVAQVAPRDGADDVPVRWHPARTGPGPRGGGAENRILAVLSNSVDAATVAPGGFQLLDSDGVVVPPLGGFPKAGPYHTHDGTHSMLFYPAADLQPCAGYRAVVTTSVRDHAGAQLARPYSWTFHTRSADGTECEAVTKPPKASKPKPKPKRKSRGGLSS